MKNTQFKSIEVIEHSQVFNKSVDLPLQNKINQSFGLGLRASHLAHIFEYCPEVDWFEIISENFMDTDGKPKNNLARLKELYPIVMHGVSLSIGSVDPLRSDYLKKLKSLVKWVRPKWISDHLCWTGVAHKTTHDLLPLPYTEEALKHVVQKIKAVQDYLEMPIAFENPSTYLEFKSSSMPEAEFIARIVEQTNCKLLLDVNNLYITCFNHRLNMQDYINTLPLSAVQQIHLAGHSHQGHYIIDTHDNYVCDEVWSLYQDICQRMKADVDLKPKVGPDLNIMIEWDDHIPNFTVLCDELQKAKNICQNIDNINNIENIKNSVKSKSLKSFKYLKSNQTTAVPRPDLCISQYIIQQGIIDFDTDTDININGNIEDLNNLKATKKIKHEKNLAAQKAEKLIKPKVNFSAQKQLAIYRESYKYRLYEVLALDYPVLKYYLNGLNLNQQSKIINSPYGDLFSELLFAFIANHPPEDFNIARFACQLPHFIKKYLPNDIFAQELCDFETHIAQIADAPESVALEMNDIIMLGEENFMKYILQPRVALKLVYYKNPINAYYAMVIDEFNVDINIDVDENVGLKPPNLIQIPPMHHSYAVVFRDEDLIWRMDCQASEYKLLEILFAGHHIQQSLEIMQKDFEGDSNLKITTEMIFNYFGRWLQQKILLKNINIQSKL